ncbi:MAG: hypothetical protein ACFNKE_00745, partial [Neisseria elongata]
MQHIGQTHVDAAGIGAGNDVSVAFNGYAVAQFFHTGVAVIGGKGLSASSLGQILRSRGLSVTMQKFDPYLNVDPGTM